MRACARLGCPDLGLTHSESKLKRLIPISKEGNIRQFYRMQHKLKVDLPMPFFPRISKPSIAKRQSPRLRQLKTGQIQNIVLQAGKEAQAKAEDCQAKQ